METADLKLDGNAIGGLLLEVFGVEMTAAVGTCGSCGAREPVGRLDVYVHAPGVVVRCPHCDSVLIRVVEGRDRLWLDVSGTRSLEITRSD
jgi:Zn finger protein HypA/HybF involved in hydrogenase expression